MLPEGIDQNSPWYTLLLDTNWVTAGGAAAEAITCAAGEVLLDVKAWVDRWALQRYGSGPGEDEAKQAWALLASTVYSDNQDGGTDREDQADALTSYPVGAAEEHVAPKPDWYNVSAVFEAWALLVSVAEKRETAPRRPGQGPPGVGGTLNYDVVNTGREVLAKIANKFFNTTATATSAKTVRARPGRLSALSVP